MKGKLLLKNKQWIVQYLEAQDAHYMCSQMTDVKELPLHPDDYAIASLLSVKNGVEFDKVDTLGQVYYAKLIQPKQEKIEETWDDIFSEYKRNGTNWASKGDATFLLWLKQNYFSPKKK